VRPRLLSDADVDRAIERIRAGEIPKHVAAGVGVHLNTLVWALTRRGLALNDVKPASSPEAWSVVHLRLADADARALNAYAHERGATASDVVRAALRAVGVTDPSRAGAVELELPARRQPPAPTPTDRTAERRARVARIVAERGRPIGKPAVLALADELGLNLRTVYRDLAALGRRLDDGDVDGDAPCD